MIVVLSDHGQTQGATFKQRNGYGLEDLVRKSLSSGDVTAIGGGDESQANVGNAVGEATGKQPKKKKNDVSGEDVVVLGSGQPRPDLPDGRAAPADAGGDRRAAPRAPARAARHPHVGWLLVRSSEHGALALGGNGTRYLETGRVEGEDPLAAFSPRAAQHLLRTDGFAHVADIMVGSFYDPDMEPGCAFEELISFHGGLGGPQTRPFVLAPADLPFPGEPIVGAAAVHGLLLGWRQHLERPAEPPPHPQNSRPWGCPRRGLSPVIDQSSDGTTHSAGMPGTHAATALRGGAVRLGPGSPLAAASGQHPLSRGRP